MQLLSFAHLSLGVYNGWMRYASVTDVESTIMMKPYISALLRSSARCVCSNMHTWWLRKQRKAVKHENLLTQVHIPYVKKLGKLLNHTLDLNEWKDLTTLTCTQSYQNIIQRSSGYSTHSLTSQIVVDFYIKARGWIMLQKLFFFYLLKMVLHFQQINQLFW